MKSQQKILFTAIAALLGGTSLTTTALAVIELTDGSTTVQGSTYASEIETITGLSVGTIRIHLAPGKASDTSTTVIPGGDTRYVRVDLENATFNTTSVGFGSASNAFMTDVSFTASQTGSVGMTDCSVATDYATGYVYATDGTNIVRYSGGASGQSYAIFKIKADGVSTNNSGLVGGCTMGINVPSIDVTKGGVPVRLVYNIYSAELAAMNDKRGDTLGSKSADLIQWASGYTFERASDSADAVADVTKNFTVFKVGEDNVNNSGTSAGRIASVGSFKLGAASGVYGYAGKQVTLGTDIFATDTSKLITTGDFSSFYTSTNSSMFITSGTSGGTANKCETGTVVKGKWIFSTVSTATNPLPDSVEFTGATGLFAASGDLSATNLYLCAELDPTVNAGSASTFQLANSATTFKITLDPIKQTNYFTLPKKEVVLHSIKRDGAVLEAPYMSITTGYSKSRVVITHLDKNGQDSDFFINLTTDKGNTVTQKLGGGVNKAGTLKKGSTMVIPISSIFETTGKPRVMASFVFYAKNEEVQGVVQHINDTTGEVTNIPMNRPGGRDGLTK